MKKLNLFLRSLVNAVLAAVYIFLVALFIYKGSSVFGDEMSLWGPFVFLLVFVLSAAVTGILVLGKPTMLYLDGQKKEAVRLLCYTVGWLFVVTFLVLLLKFVV